MTSVSSKGNNICLMLSREEVLVLFEWLSRNWEKTQWGNAGLFVGPAEKQLLIWMENDLATIFKETFDQDYKSILCSSYRKLVPDE